MRTEKEILEHLENDELYQTALKSVDDDKDKARIRATVEPLFVDTMMAIEKFVDLIRNNPDVLSGVDVASHEGDPIVTDVPAASGSTE